MLNRNALLKFASLAVIGLMTVGSPALIQAASPAGSANAGSIALPPAGMGSILLVNYDGGSEELDVNFAGTLYKVPPETDGTPSQMEINLAPGTYTYSASVAGNHTTINNSIDVAAGKVISLGFVDNLPDVQNGDEGRDDEIAHKATTSDPDAKSDKAEKVNNDGDNDKSEKSIIAKDNDDLLLTVVDVTAQAQ